MIEYILPNPALPLRRQRELTLLALCVFGEARGESQAGRNAIAHVVLNRWKAGGWFGSTITDVLLKPYQFSCFNSKDPNYKLLLNPGNISGWKESAEAAIAAYFGYSTDPTGGATYYHTKTVKPTWVTTFTKTKTIGNHVFYR